MKFQLSGFSDGGFSFIRGAASYSLCFWTRRGREKRKKNERGREKKTKQNKRRMEKERKEVAGFHSVVEKM